jgi:hypothetical protein
MPNYTIQTPDRRTVRVRAPDAASAIRDVTGYVTTAARAVPFLTEAGAGYSAGLRSLDDVISRRAPDFGGNWARARAEQQAIIDAYHREHPFLSNNALALGTVGPMVVGALGAGRAAQSIARIAPAAAPKVGIAANNANALRALRSVARNAFMGAGAGAVYGAARPGDLQQRAQYAADSLGPGAVWGAGVPLGLEGAARGGVGVARAVGETAHGTGALGSELFDTLRRAATGRTPADQSRPISYLADGRGEADAVRQLRQMGVSPEALEQARTLAFGKPVTTAEAIGPEGMELAQGLRGRAGTTDEIANAMLSQRAAARPERLLMDAGKAAGAHPSAVLGDLDQLFEDSRQKGDSYMNEARNLLPPFNEQLRKISDSDETEDLYLKVWDYLNQRGLRTTASLPGAKFFEDAASGRVPSLDYYDALKNHLQYLLEGLADPLNKKQQVMRRMADELHANLISTPPTAEAYAKAHELQGDRSSIEAAWRDAQGQLLDPAVDPSSFDADFSKLMPFERDTAAAAGAGDIANLAYEQPFNSGVVSDPAVFQKMGMLFGKPGAQQLAGAVRTEGGLADFEQPPPNGISGLNLRLRAAGQAPLNMAGRNALGRLLYQDPEATAQMMRAYGGGAPNAFVGVGLRLPPLLQYGTAGLAGSLQAPGMGASPSQP